MRCKTNNDLLLEVDIDLEETEVFPGQLASVKAQFKIPMFNNHEVISKEEIFTYKYSDRGVVGIYGQSMPKILRDLDEIKKEYLMKDLNKLKNEIDNSECIILEPEHRIMNTKEFVTAYSRYEYGYSVCAINVDSEDFKKYDEILKHFNNDVNVYIDGFHLVLDMYIMEDKDSDAPNYAGDYLILEMKQGGNKPVKNNRSISEEAAID